MNSWIDKYKKLVISSHKDHLILMDEDNLFDYPELKSAFESDGYKIFKAKTALQLRIKIELEIRNSAEKWIILAPNGYKVLPDLESIAKVSTFGLPNLFPNLDSKAIRGLSFNALCMLSNIKPYEELTHDKTLKFLLENLYNVDFDTLTNSKAKERILNALITVLLEKNGINSPVTKYLENISKPYFPLLVNKGLSTSNLIDFIQHEWNNYVNGSISELNFNEPILSKSLGYLLAHEYLKPVKVSNEKYSEFPKHLKIGVFTDANGNNDNELEGLIDYLKQQIEIIEDIPDQWFKIIQVVSNAKLKGINSLNEDLKKDLFEVENKLNVRFQRFIDNTYGSLFSLSGIRKPVVVSRVLEHINSKPENKKALLVIDGMNYWQWNLLAQKLSTEKIQYTSSASLAYIPTITAWSRQAIFKGDKPELTEDNSKESKLFFEYWLKKGLSEFNIAYSKFGVNNKFEVSTLNQDTKIIGLVCNDLDEAMHGSNLGNEQLKATTELWISNSNICGLIKELSANGFAIFITSDHGNIEAIGLKNLSLKEKVGSLSRGKRHLHFTNETMMDNFLKLNSELNIGKRGLSVYLKNTEAFTNESSVVITHGGSHLWEVIVPFIFINGK